MTKKKAPQLDTEFFRYAGHIAHDWATLEYMISHTIWKAAGLDDVLGACITAQIYSLPPKIGALRLLLRSRGVSNGLLEKLNAFSERSREYSEIRNRAVHDPLGVHATDNSVRQIQITAQGKLVFETRKVTLEEFEKFSERISSFLSGFIDLKNEIEDELSKLPYTHQRKFPVITRGTL